MDKIKIDSHFAALKMIEILLQKGLINQSTYATFHRQHNFSYTILMKRRLKL